MFVVFLISFYFNMKLISFLVVLIRSIIPFWSIYKSLSLNEPFEWEIKRKKNIQKLNFTFNEDTQRVNAIKFKTNTHAHSRERNSEDSYGGERRVIVYRVIKKITRSSTWKSNDDESFDSLITESTTKEETEMRRHTHTKRAMNNP